jgi:hypothetical protein
MKNQPVRYYFDQAGSGSPDGVIGPIYAIQPFIQRGHGIGSFLSNLFQLVRPVLRSDSNLWVESNCVQTVKF